MLTQRARRILLPGISALFLAFILACGTETAPVSPDSNPVKIVTEATTPQESMTKDTMDKSTETMAKDTMEKSTETMAKDTMEKSSETMAKDTMEKSTETMAKDTMEKSTETMAKDTMEKAAETMAKDTMEKSTETMAKDTMEKMVAITVSDTLMLQLSDIQPLHNGFHYEGWAIVNGAPVTTGKFNVGPDGALIALNGSPIPQGAFETGVDLNNATAVIITIEPAGDNDAIPASTHYLSGSVYDGTASLSIAHSAALGDDFSGASGNYILATPTDGAGNNENSGIWFLDLSSGTPSVGLDLPSLPEGWVYEGWGVIDGTPVSTGRFTQVGQTDLSAPYSGAKDGPPFPGEDFLLNPPEGLTFPVDLAGKVAVISVEPSPDDSPAPFALKPLVSIIPANATDHVNYLIGAPEARSPSGSATIDIGEMSKTVQASG